MHVSLKFFGIYHELNLCGGNNYLLAHVCGNIVNHVYFSLQSLNRWTRRAPPQALAKGQWEHPCFTSGTMISVCVCEYD